MSISCSRTRQRALAFLSMCLFCLATACGAASNDGEVIGLENDAVPTLETTSVETTVPSPRAPRALHRSRAGLLPAAAVAAPAAPIVLPAPRSLRGTNLVGMEG